MQLPSILLPLFVEVLLTPGLLLWMVPLRQGDFSKGVARHDTVALREPNWSKKTLQVGYCFSNQFELPVLFYVLTILEIVTRQADLIFMILAWIFVLTRIMHAMVYTTSNKVRMRGAWYGFGATALAIAWVIYMVRILFILP
jgi:hypothetical protein